MTEKATAELQGPESDELPRAEPLLHQALTYLLEQGLIHPPSGPSLWAAHGMRFVEPGSGVEKFVGAWAPMPDDRVWMLDPNHPASKGWLLQYLREGSGDETLFAAYAPDDHCWGLFHFSPNNDPLWAASKCPLTGRVESVITGQTEGQVLEAGIVGLARVRGMKPQGRKDV